MFYVDIHLVPDGGGGGQDETFLAPPQQLRARLGEDVHLPCPTRDTGQETLYLMSVDVDKLALLWGEAQLCRYGQETFYLSVDRCTLYETVPSESICPVPPGIQVRVGDILLDVCR